MDTARTMESTAGGEGADKYMNPVPIYLSNLVEYLNKDLSTLPQWEVDLMAQIQASLQFRLKDHFEASAEARSMFASMPDELWQEPETKLFPLTENPRKILGYLSKSELKRLDNMTRVPMTATCEEYRAELIDLFDQMRASEEDRAEIAHIVGMEDYFFANIEAHRAKIDEWRPIHEAKMPIIHDLEQREEFLEEIEEFESKATGDKDRYKKSNSLALADENKFRAYAAKKLKEIDSKAIKACRKFEADHGREFQIDGVKYLEMIKEQKYGRMTNPGLNLGKLKVSAIPQAEKEKFQGGVVSNLVPTKEEGMKKRQSYMEQGIDPKIIRHGK